MKSNLVLLGKKSTELINRGETNYQHQNKIGGTMSATEIKVLIREYYEIFCTSNMTTYSMAQLIESYNLPKPTQ